jgi:hypothetical protein
MGTGRSSLEVNRAVYEVDPSLFSAAAYCTCVRIWVYVHVALRGHAEAQLVEALRYKTEGRGKFVLT